MPTRRQERINQRLVEEVSEALRKVKDPRIGFLTVTDAEISPDLRNARIFISVLGDEVKQNESLNAVTRAAGFLRHELGDSLQMKVTPRLQFVLDQRIQHADEMNQLINLALSTGTSAKDAEDEDLQENAESPKESDES